MCAGTSFELSSIDRTTHLSKNYHVVHPSPREIGVSGKLGWGTNGWVVAIEAEEVSAFANGESVLQ